MSTRDGFHAATRPARFGRPPWRKALELVAGAPRRLHRYRALRTRMLREVLSQLDCPQDERRTCHE